MPSLENWGGRLKSLLWAQLSLHMLYLPSSSSIVTVVVGVLIEVSGSIVAMTTLRTSVSSQILSLIIGTLIQSIWLSFVESKTRSTDTGV